MYGQVQVRSGDHQGSSVNRRCQCKLFFVGRLWHLRSLLPQGNQLLLNVSGCYPGRLGPRERKVCPGRATAEGFSPTLRALTGSDQSHEDLYRGVHWVILEGCAFLYLPVIVGVCIYHYQCTPLSRVEIHTPLYIRGTLVRSSGRAVAPG